MLISGRKGFTLIELLIVVAIFGILGGTFHQMLQESFRRHAANSFDQKILWLLDGQEAILRSTPYHELPTGTHPFTQDIVQGTAIPGVSASFTTEEMRPTLKKITMVAGFPIEPGKQRTQSVVVYRSNQ